MTMEHANHTAVITGAGAGIGEAIARALAAEGAMVVVADVKVEAAETVAKSIRDAGGNAEAMLTDVTDRASVEAMARHAETAHGGIDILVNNAGVQHVAPLIEFLESDWRRLIDVMLTGTFLCTQAAVRSMISKRRGWIVNIASQLGKEGAAYKCAYTAAKHGIIGLTRSNALELAEHEIRVNAICPGLTRTQLVEDQLDDLARAHGYGRDEVLDRLYYPRIPQKRALEPKEIADCAVFLCSKRAGAFTGQALNVSAGAIME